jgi:hypothetical protein
VLSDFAKHRARLRRIPQRRRARAAPLLRADGPLYYRQGMRAAGKDYKSLVSTLRASRAPRVFTHADDTALLQQAVDEAGASASVHAYERAATLDGGAARAERVSSDSPRSILTGTAVGLVMLSLSGAAVVSLPRADYALGSAINQATRQSSSVFGVAQYVTSPTRAGAARTGRSCRLSSVARLGS